MKICLVSAKNSIVHILPGISQMLRSNVFGLSVSEKVADTALDIVKEVSNAKGFDFVIVVLHYSKDRVQIRVLMEKLVDLDVAGKPTLKFLVRGEDFDENEQVERISDLILEKLFPKKSNGGGAKKRSFKGI